MKGCPSNASVQPKHGVPCCGLVCAFKLGGLDIKTQTKNNNKKTKTHQYLTEVSRQQKVKRNNEKSHETTISGKYHKPKIVKKNQETILGQSPENNASAHECEWKR
jgi:hypothetical protein